MRAVCPFEKININEKKGGPRALGQRNSPQAGGGLQQADRAEVPALEHVPQRPRLEAQRSLEAAEQRLREAILPRIPEESYSLTIAFETSKKMYEIVEIPQVVAANFPEKN